MLFSREETTPHTINTYTNHSITVDGKCYDSPILISCQGVIELAGGIRSLKELDRQALREYLKAPLLILGKNHIDFFDLKHLRSDLAQSNINLEAMPIGSACRTFNVLQAEGREVMLLILFE